MVLVIINTDGTVSVVTQTETETTGAEFTVHLKQFLRVGTLLQSAFVGSGKCYCLSRSRKLLWD